MYTEPKGQVNLEKQLMDLFLYGDDPVLKELRHQYQNSIIVSRTFTGAGFYVNFKVKSEISPIASKKNFEIMDVTANIVDTDDKLGFILFIRDGYIKMLEGYIFGLRDWPEDYSNIKLFYIDSNENKNRHLDTRNFVELIKKFS